MVRWFGTTIRETIAAFTGATLGPAPEGTPAPGGPPVARDDRIAAVTRMVISVLLFALGGFLLVRDGSSQTGVALLTLVAGYWLK